jgi:DNA-binding beta-propeller fold protein YncE
LVTVREEAPEAELTKIATSYGQHRRQCRRIQRKDVKMGGRTAFAWSTAAIIGAAAWLAIARPMHRGSIGDLRARGRTGVAQLVAVEPMPMAEGEQCELVPVSATSLMSAALQQTEETTPLSAGDTAKRAPLREIHDPYSSFSSIAVDMKHDEVVMTDENLFRVLVFDRRTNTPASASMSEPRRVIGGAKTKIEFQCGLYIDQASGDIYAVNNDTVDTLAIFSRKAKGNVEPDREIHTPHGTFGIAVDDARKELFLTVQHSNSIVVYDKMAKGDDKPLRMIQGNATGLADPHGITLDAQHDLMFVSNHGSTRSFRAAQPNSTIPELRDIPGTGHIVPSSITVYSLDAKGDAPPLRVISGPSTQLDWPTGLAVDEDRGELYVANDMGDSVLVFKMDAEGNAAPLRVLKGPKTGLKNPTGINLDTQNGELLVANFGNHTATAYKLPAGGDSAPLRKIRSGPSDQPALMIGNPGTVAYDSKREEILVAN